MRLGVQINYAGDIGESIAKVVALEKAGLDLVLVPEAYGFDAISLLGFIAARTSRVALGPGIIPIYSRTPALIAQTAAGLDYVSNGRAVLGLGASGPQVIEGWHGVAYDRPVTRTRETVEIARQVWRRERVVHQGLLTVPLQGGSGLGKALKMITHPLRDRIPVYLAAIGPANVQLAAEIAEGWLPFLLIPERKEAVWGAALEAGRARRDPALGELETIAGGILAMGGDVEAARSVARQVAALYIGGMGAKGRNFYNDLASRYGFGGAAEAIQDRYLAGSKEDAAAKVPEELVSASNLIGDVGFLRERLQAYRSAGVSTLLVDPVGSDPVGSFRVLRRLTE